MNLDALGDAIAEALDDPDVGERGITALIDEVTGPITGVRMKAAAQGQSGAQPPAKSSSSYGAKPKGKTNAQGQAVALKGKGTGGAAAGGKSGGSHAAGHAFFGNQHVTAQENTQATGPGVPGLAGATALQQLEGAAKAALGPGKAKKGSKGSSGGGGGGKGGGKGGGSGSGGGGGAGTAASAATAAAAKATAAAKLAANKAAASLLPPTRGSDAQATAINGLPPAMKANLQATQPPPAGYVWKNGSLAPTAGSYATQTYLKAGAAAAHTHFLKAQSAKQKTQAMKVAAEQAARQPLTAASAKTAASVNTLPPKDRLWVQQHQVPPPGFQWQGGVLVERRSEAGLDPKDVRKDWGRDLAGHWKAVASAADAKGKSMLTVSDGTHTYTEKGTRVAKASHIVVRQPTVVGTYPGAREFGYTTHASRAAAQKVHEDNVASPAYANSWLVPVEHEGQRDMVGEGGSAGLLLPVGLSGNEADAIEAEEVDPHKFVGKNVMACDKCGQPLTANVHRSRVGSRHAGPGHQRVFSGHEKGARGRRVKQARAQYDSDVARVEPGLETAMKSHFAKQRSSTINRLTGKRGKQMLKRAAEQPPETPEGGPILPPGEPVEGASAGAVDPNAIFDSAFWAGETAAVLQPHLNTVGALATARVKSQAKVPDGHDGASLARVSDVLSQRAQNSAMKITDTTRAGVFNALQQGVANGESIPQITDRINAVFDNADAVRAKMIAQTETIGASNQAAHEYASTMPPGLIGSHTWLAHSDDRTRPHHRTANGQTVPLDQPFMVGGYAMDHPGDPTAPPSEVINCRCGVGYNPGTDDSYTSAIPRLEGLVPQSTLTALKDVQVKVSHGAPVPV